MKSKYLILPLLAGIIHVNVFAQPVIKSQRVAGGNSYDQFTCMALTKDGGLIAGGYSISDSSGEKTENSRGGYDYWIVKYDSEHNIQWDKTIGGNNNDGYNRVIVQQISDGGYVVAGSSESGKSGEKTENSRGEWDYWIVKLDNSGHIQWDKTIGGNDIDALSSMQQTGDGGYILGGSSVSNISGEKTENRRGDPFLYDYWIVKLDGKGNIQWDKTIGGSGSDALSSLQQTSDGGYILGGGSGSNASGEKTENSRGYPNYDNDYWIVKLNSMGNIQWDKTIGGSNSDGLNSLQQTSDGGYILGGYSLSNKSGEKTENNRDTNLYSADYWLIKLDNKGNIQWDKTIGGNVDDWLTSQQTSDGGYILGGQSRSDISGEKTENNRNPHAGTNDYWIVKLKANGKFQWDKTIGGNSGDACSSIMEIGKNRYLAGGASDSRTTGDKKRLNRGPKGTQDFWLVGLFYKTGNHPLTASAEDIASISAPNTAAKSFSLYPNPAKDVLHIQTTGKAIISLTDASGKTVVTQTINGKGEMNTSRLKAGVYYLKNHATGEVKKVVVER